MTEASNDQHWDPDLGIDITVAHPARVYDYWLGGKDNFAPDRVAGDRVLAVTPGLRYRVRANRAFLGRTVRYLAAEAGIRQFLDLGTGIPSAPVAPGPGRRRSRGDRLRAWRRRAEGQLNRHRVWNKPLQGGPLPDRSWALRDMMKARLTLGGGPA